MGFHVCEYCREETSSGDVTLAFDSGRTWVVPDMILHYVAEHGYQPSAFFVHDVTRETLRSGSRSQTKGVTEPIREGYLSGPFPSGAVPEGFFVALWRVMRQAERGGRRVQTRSF